MRILHSKATTPHIFPIQSLSFGRFDYGTSKGILLALKTVMKLKYQAMFYDMASLNRAWSSDKNPRST